MVFEWLYFTIFMIVNEIVGRKNDSAFRHSLQKNGGLRYRSINLQSILHAYEPLLLIIPFSIELIWV